MVSTYAHTVQVIIVTDRDPASLIGERVEASRGNEAAQPKIIAAEAYDGDDRDDTVILTLGNDEPFITNGRGPWFVKMADALWGEMS